MSYVEFESVLFRGTLAGATGEVDFNLSASAIAAVSGINIKGKAIVYGKTVASSGNANAGATVLSLQVNVLDTKAGVGIYAAYSRGGTVYLNGSPLPALSNGDLRYPLFPYFRLLHLNKGSHELTVRSDSTGPYTGHITVRYYRNTGSGNQ